MRQGKFFIAVRDSSEDTPKLQEVKGWLDDSGLFGFHQNAKKTYWAATDLATGFAICWRGTRKQCVEYIEENTSYIQKLYGTPEYQSALKLFESASKRNK